MTSKQYERGLVLSGGGSKGAFQVGVIKHLIEQGIKWDVVIGVSVGSINGAAIAMYDKDNVQHAIDFLEFFWRNKIDNDHIYKPWSKINILNYPIAYKKKSMHSSAPLRKLLRQNIGPKELKQSNVDFFLGTCSFNDGRYHVKSKQEMSEEEMITWIMASAGFPVMLEPVIINGVTYLDGGLRNNVPLTDALKLNVKHLDVITTDPLGGHVKLDTSAKTLIDIFVRSAEILSDEVFLADLKENSTKFNTDIDIYSPSHYLTDNSLDFSPSITGQMIDIGYRTSPIHEKTEREDLSRKKVVHLSQLQNHGACKSCEHKGTPHPPNICKYHVCTSVRCSTTLDSKHVKEKGH